MHRTDLIAIGELAARTGVAVSAIRFYEARIDRRAAHARRPAPLPARRHPPRVLHPDRAADGIEPRRNRRRAGAATRRTDTQCRRLDADQHRAARAHRRPDRGADAHPRAARSMYRLRLSEPEKMRAVQRAGQGRAAWRRAALCAGRPGRGDCGGGVRSGRIFFGGGVGVGTKKVRAESAEVAERIKGFTRRRGDAELKPLLIIYRFISRPSTP